MLYSVFLRPCCRRRLSSYDSSDLKIMETYCKHLSTRGYCVNTIQLYVRCLEHLTVWLRKEKKRSLSSVRKGDITEFQSIHLNHCTCAGPMPKYLVSVRAALSHLDSVIEFKVTGYQRKSNDMEIVEEFALHLRDVSGLAATTCIAQRRYAAEFIKHCFRFRAINWRKIQNKQIISFVTSYGSRCSAATAAQAAIGLRSFLRFLQMKGLVNPLLLAAVPHIAVWRLSGLPQVMNKSQIRQFLTVLRKNKNSGKRDLSIGLIQLVLGLRVSEVSTLKLSDIDWRQSVLKISEGKCQRSRILPLTPTIRDALANYILHERPKDSCSYLFIRYRPPKGAAVSKELIRGIVRRAYTQVDGGDKWTGTHLLRRTAATRIHQQGVKLKEVADILGHLSIDTTSIYTKLDIPTLRNVALPWPLAVKK